MSTFKILAFDGGGVRGALSTRILLSICEKYPDFLNSIDLFAGTSTGSIIALALAAGKNAKFIDNLYNYTNTKEIFSSSRLNLFKAKYSNEKLKAILSQVFAPDLTLKDLNKFVFIPSFDLSGNNTRGWEPFFFHNIKPNYTDKYSVIDVVLSSSAAPTIFPSHKEFIDGGVIASSPTTVSAFAVLNETNLVNSNNDLVILSIGTGDLPYRITKKNCNWGIFQWVYNPFAKITSPLISILLEGSTLVDHMYCSQLFKNNYHRINPVLLKDITLDDYKHVNYLKRYASTIDLSETFKFIESKILKN